MISIDRLGINLPKPSYLATSSYFQPSVSNILDDVCSQVSLPQMLEPAHSAATQCSFRAETSEPHFSPSTPSILRASAQSNLKTPEQLEYQRPRRRPYIPSAGAQRAQSSRQQRGHPVSATNLYLWRQISPLFESYQNTPKKVHRNSSAK